MVSRFQPLSLRIEARVMVSRTMHRVIPATGV
jgi:hypothetical protein